MIGLASIDFFSPDQRIRRGKPPLDLDVELKNDIGFFGALSGCYSGETNSYNPVTLGFGLPSYDTE